MTEVATGSGKEEEKLCETAEVAEARISTPPSHWAAQMGTDSFCECGH